MSHRALGHQWDEYASVEITPTAVTERRQRDIGDWRRLPGWDSAPVEHVEVKRLQPTQRFLFQHQHDRVRQAEVELPPVKVVRKGKTHYVVDGHHRWDAAKQRGDKTIRAQVLDR